MGRIMAIDYGKKRVGIAVTDPLGMIANAIGTVKTHEVFLFFEDYFKKEKIEKLVLGYPLQVNDTESESMEIVRQFKKGFERKYPAIPVVFEDERFTSLLAKQAMIEGGMKKKDRQKKENIDKISATIILQSYLERMENENRHS